MTKPIRILQILLKNIFKYKRNYFIMFAIGFSAFIIILGGGYTKGVEEQVLNLMHNGYTGNITIIAKQVDLKSNPGPIQVGWNDMLIDSGSINNIMHEANIKAALKRLVLIANIMGEDVQKNEYITIIGCEFNKEENYSFKTLLNFDNNKKNSGIYISKKIASKLKLKTGDFAYLFILSDSGIPVPARFIVGAIFDGKGFPNLADNIVYINYPDLKNAMHLSINNISSVLVMVKDKDQIDSTIIRLKKIVPNDWKIVSSEISGSFFKTINKTYNFILNFSFILMYICIFLFIYSTLMISINSSKKEIGIMSSLGLAKKTIFFIFTCQGILLALFPAIIGSLCGLITISVLSKIGIPAANDAMKYAFASDRLYLKINLFSFFYSLILIPVIAFIAATFPTIKILKLKPVEALNELKL